MITPSLLPNIGFVDNTLPLRLSSDAYQITAEQKAVTKIEFVAVPNDATNFTIRAFEGEYEFTFFFAENPGEFAFAFTVSADPVIDWLENYFLPEVNQNLELTQRWSVSRQGNAVLFKALEGGTDGEISLVDNPGYLVVTTQTSGVDGFYRDQMSIYLKLFYRPYGTEDWKSKEYEAAANKGVAEFFINRLLTKSDGVTPDFGFGLDSIKEVSSAVIEYKLRYTELLGGTIKTANKFSDSPTYLALPGGTKSNEFGRENIEQVKDSKAGWLTNRDVFRIIPGQLFYLSFWYGLPGRFVDVVAEVTYTDLSTETILLFGGQWWEKDRIYTIPLGWDVLAPKLNVDKTPFRLSVYARNVVGAIGEALIDQTTRISLEVYRQPVRELTQVFYRNSLGFFEIAAFTGDVKVSGDFTNKTSTFEFPFEQPYLWRSGRNHSAKYRILREVEIGYRTRVEIEQLSDLLVSTDVRLVKDGEFVPVILELGKKELYSTLSGRKNSYSLIFKDPKPNKHYSNGHYSI
jgi:hypothetical protein